MRETYRYSNSGQFHVKTFWEFTDNYDFWKATTCCKWVACQGKWGTTPPLSNILLVPNFSNVQSLIKARISGIRYPYLENSKSFIGKPDGIFFDTIKAPFLFKKLATS